MTKENLNNYSITANYNEQGNCFEKILEKHIKNLLKLPTGSWNLENYDIKYRWQIVINESEKGGNNGSSW